MTLPARIKVGCIRYAVLTDGRRIPNTMAGQHDQQHQEIRLDLNQGPDVRRCVLLHEVLHAVLDHAGADQGDNEDDEARKRLEGFIDALCPGLVLVLEENPDLVAFLTATDG
jgi:hypothetical protein